MTPHEKLYDHIARIQADKPVEYYSGINHILLFGSKLKYRDSDNLLNLLQRHPDLQSPANIEQITSNIPVLLATPSCYFGLLEVVRNIWKTSPHSASAKTLQHLAATTHYCRGDSDLPGRANKAVQLIDDTLRARPDLLNSELLDNFANIAAKPRFNEVKTEPRQQLWSLIANICKDKPNFISRNLLRHAIKKTSHAGFNVAAATIIHAALEVPGLVRVKDSIGLLKAARTGDNIAAQLLAAMIDGKHPASKHPIFTAANFLLGQPVKKLLGTPNPYRMKKPDSNNNFDRQRAMAELGAELGFDNAELTTPTPQHSPEGAALVALDEVVMIASNSGAALSGWLLGKIELVTVLNQSLLNGDIALYGAKGTEILGAASEYELPSCSNNSPLLVPIWQVMACIAKHSDGSVAEQKNIALFRAALEQQAANGYEITAALCKLPKPPAPVIMATELPNIVAAIALPHDENSSGAAAPQITPS